MSKKSPPISAGSKVKWTSQAAGSHVVKVGTVVEVVRAGQRPATKLDGGGWPRDHESFVVEARPVVRVRGIKSPRLGRLKAYWPIASALRPWSGDEHSANSWKVGRP